MAQGDTILFTDRNAIIKRTVIGGNVDPEKIIPHLYSAQNKYVLPLLGSVLYNKLQDDVKNNAVTGSYKTLIDNYITDTLVQYTVVESLPFLAYSITNGGISKHVSPEQGEAVNKNEVDFLLEKSLQSAEFFAQRLVNYLIAHNSDYPEYTQSTGFSDTIFPNKSSTYNCGWVI